MKRFTSSLNPVVALHFFAFIMVTIQSYNVTIDETRLRTLGKKLELADFPDELEAAEWDYGAPLKDIKRLTAYWKDSFDWGEQVRKINKLPNFQTKVDVEGFEPLNIHFIHKKSDAPNAIPLLFVHGCQSTIHPFPNP